MHNPIRSQTAVIIPLALFILIPASASEATSPRLRDKRSLEQRTRDRLIYQFELHGEKATQENVLNTIVNSPLFIYESNGYESNGNDYKSFYGKIATAIELLDNSEEAKAAIIAYLADPQKTDLTQFYLLWLVRMNYHDEARHFSKIFFKNEKIDNRKKIFFLSMLVPAEAPKKEDVISYFAEEDIIINALLSDSISCRRDALSVLMAIEQERLSLISKDGKFLSRGILAAAALKGVDATEDFDYYIANPKEFDYYHIKKADVK